MKCPNCGVEMGGDACPRCGQQRPALSGAVRTSTILISKGATEAVYRSVDEVPDPLRTELLETTSGDNSALILIADQRGREELARVLRQIPAPPPPVSPAWWLRGLLGVALLAAVVAFLWWWNTL
ncbi:MAG: hypothetical protein ACRD96_20895 [Bryobacteraceae bacterium]